MTVPIIIAALTMITIIVTRKYMCMTNVAGTVDISGDMDSLRYARTRSMMSLIPLQTMVLIGANYGRVSVAGDERICC